MLSEEAAQDSEHAMAKMIVRMGSGRQREYELGAVNTVGRHPMQTIQVLDPQVSKEHMVIEQGAGGKWILRDLGSLNGSYVNGDTVSGTRPLRHRDRITVGSAELVFFDPRSIPTGDHKVVIGDSIESSICEAIEHRSSGEMLPADRIQDVNILRRDYEKLRLAARLSQDIALEVRLDKLLPRILDVLMPVFQADRGVILLKDESGHLTARAVRIHGSTTTHEEISLSETIIETVLKEHKAVLTSDAQRDARFSGAHSVILHGIRATMCVPLLTRDANVIGVIHLDSLLKPGAFTDRDLGVLQGVASQAAIAIENSLLVSQIEREAVMRQKYERMLSPNLVERVVSGDLAIEKGGELRDVSVMFTDIRDFTPMSEQMGAQPVVKMLNEYFEVVTEIVFDYQGTLDKFIGDAVMAFWGAPVGDPDHARKAVQAAIEVQKALRHFNEVRRIDRLPALQTGVGIDSGECVAGWMGSSKTMEYTVIGPRVNTAARLCAAATGDQILITGSAYERVATGIACHARDPMPLKGIREPVVYYEVADSWTL
jgi:adenylate cyclase